MSRLYYTDSLLTEFDATVVETGTLEGRPFVVLDRTAFYPTSGGQPFDTGRLGDVQVVDVLVRDADDAVLHVVEQRIESGLPVRGEIDRARRLDHMQQHTGQHVLSAALVRTDDAHTVSFHLGTEVCTIDVAADLSTEAVARGEDEANRVVWQNRPVTVRFVSDAEASRLPLRKEPARTGTLRLIEIEDFDLSACGGTHVSRTGAIGVIAVTAFERYKGGTRISFVCGGRALRQFRRLRDAAGSAARLLSVQTGELHEAVERLQSDAREARLQTKALQEQLVALDADSLRRSAVDMGGRRVVVAARAADAQTLKLLAQAIAGADGPAVLLVSQSRPALVVVARGGQSGVDANAVVKSLIARFGGRGGGRPELAQAGGLDADVEALLEAGPDFFT
jgi:alanyl-tRNA synthetase